jgi:hypothetical protein
MNKAIGLVGFGLSGILTLAAVLPAGAAPVMTSTAQVGTVATDQVTQVRWRGGAAVAAGVGAGIALGALAASQPHYYGYGGYYDYEPSYGYSGGPYYGYAGAPYYGSTYSYGYQGYEPYYYEGGGRRDTNGSQNW